MKKLFHQIIILVIGFIPEKVSIISLNQIGALALLLSPILFGITALALDLASLFDKSGPILFVFDKSLFSQSLLILASPAISRFYSTSSNNRPSNKTPLQRFWKGVVIGWNMPVLPDNVSAFYNHPITRIFRVTGGICFILWLSKLYESIGINLMLILPIAMLHLIIIVTISLIKIKYIISLWRNGKLDVRNSPLDKLATFGLRLVACAKGVCVYGIGTGGVISLGLGIDEILDSSGRSRVFKPLAGRVVDNMLNKLGIDNPNIDITKTKNEIDQLKYKVRKFETLHRDLDQIKTDISNEEDKELLNFVKEYFEKEIMDERIKLKELISDKEKALMEIEEINQKQSISKSLILKEIYREGTPFVSENDIAEGIQRSESPFKRNLEAGNEIERTESPSKIRKLRGKREYSTKCQNGMASSMYSTDLNTLHNKTMLDNQQSNLSGSQIDKNIMKKNNLPTEAKYQFDIGKLNMFIQHSPFNDYLKKLINDKTLSLENRQLAIEKYLQNTWGEFLEDKDPKVLNQVSFIFIRTLFSNFQNILQIALAEIKPAKKKLVEPLFRMDRKQITVICLKILMSILNSGKKQKYTNTAMKVGNSIIKAWIIQEYRDKKKQFCETSFTQLKEEMLSRIGDTSTLQIMELDIGNILLQIANDSGNLLRRKTEKLSSGDTTVWIEPTEEATRILSKQFLVLGFHLPMIVPPNVWSPRKNGGYFSNQDFYDNTEILIHQSVENIGKSQIKEKNLVYKEANYIQNVPFQINKKVLEFILEKGVELELILSDIHPNTGKPNLNKKEKEQVEKHNSRFFLERNIIGIASLFADVDKFYFPVYLDWRGRLYSACEYLSFQGNELSKALLQFANSGEIKKPALDTFRFFGDNDQISNEEGFYFLKIYGANCFGNGYNKKSYFDRIKWVDDNHDAIISMDLALIKKAENPILFLAFSYEYKKCIEVFESGEFFTTQLPIQLDASCNGIQHLASILVNHNLAKMVNLLDSEVNQEPQDIYLECAALIQKKVQELIKEQPSFDRLGSLTIDRKMIKQSIMTIPYTVSIIGVKNQIEQMFSKEHKNGTTFLKPENPKHGNVYITNKELMALAKIVHSILYETHPRLKELVTYFEKMATLLTELKLPIAWVTPSGLHINQEYIRFQSYRVNHNLYKGSKAVTIRIPTKKIDIRKQKQSIMPNLIHSLDGAVIALMISKIGLFKKINLFTIHDCFATTADQIGTLNTLVREAFLEIYSNEVYLNKLQEFLVYYISLNYPVSGDKKVVFIDSKKIEIPIPPKGNNYINFFQKIKKAIYMIH